MLASRRAVRWAAPLLVIFLAAFLRLWNLGTPSTLVFDETFYVKDAWTLVNNGYESAWPEGADALFAAGQSFIFLSDPSFVVHPPLGKWLIGLGMLVVGPDSAWGWRITTALIGVLAVALLMFIAHRLFGSLLLATIAGFLFAIDGHAIVMSRVALLDNSVMFFALLGFGAVLLDRSWHENRLAGWIDDHRTAGRRSGWGPALWWRPWLLAAGLAFGLASSVKWSGLYFLAVFGVYVVVVDALARRRAGLPFWFSGAVLKQAPVSFLLLVPIAMVAYVTSWWGWFATRGGYYRDWAEGVGAAWTGALDGVPLTVQSFVHYQSAAYTYHVGLSTPHPYQANPLTWLFMIRPTSMFYEGSSRGENGCLVDTCSAAITSIGNPLIWWAATAALFYLVYRLARYREWRVGLILTGMAAGYLPWLMYLGRTVFQFYTIAFEPYLVLGLTLVIGLILNHPSVRRVPPGPLAAPAPAEAVAVAVAVAVASEPGPEPEPGLRRSGIALVAVFLGVATLLSVFFYPLWTGAQTSFQFWQLHIWLESWR